MAGAGAAAEVSNGSASRREIDQFVTQIVSAAATQGFRFGLNSSMRSLAGRGGATSSSVCQVTDQQSAASGGDSTAGSMVGVRGYRRALRVSELVGSWKAGPWGPL